MYDDRRTIQNYIVWRVVMSMASDLTQKYMEAGAGFRKVSTHNSKNEYSRKFSNV